MPRYILELADVQPLGDARDGLASPRYNSTSTPPGLAAAERFSQQTGNNPSRTTLIRCVRNSCGLPFPS